MEKIKNLISIIIPIYNAQEMLPRCLDHLLDQTYESVELILVNDGSTDRSLEICKEYARRSEKIRVISQENGGTAKARNTGLEVARGEFVMFVDADDYMKTDYCQTLHSAIVAHGVSCVVSGHIAVDGEIQTVRTVQEEKIISGKESLHEMYCNGNRGIGLVEVWGKIFHHSMWDNLRFQDGLYYEDLEIMPRLYYDCEKIMEIPYAGYYYVTYEESASNGKGTDDKRVWDSIAIRKIHIDFFSARNDQALVNAMNGRLLDLIIGSAKNGWIPNESISKVFQLYRHHWKQYRKSASLPLGVKMRYEGFGLSGKYFFKPYNG